jgi:AcrR family transcriptional regulator
MKSNGLNGGGIRGRERGKQARRTRIIEATIKLLREVGVARTSMTLIAARAGVSSATPYNLFGTKADILAAVFDQDLRSFESSIANLRSPNALDRLFKAIGIAASLYKSDPDFYRATMFLTDTRRNQAIHLSLYAPRMGFMQRMAEDLITEGFILPGVDSTIFAVALKQLANGALFDWYMNRISPDRLRDETEFGFAVTLRGVATARAKHSLEQRISALAQVLKEPRTGGAISAARPRANLKAIASDR